MRKRLPSLFSSLLRGYAWVTILLSAGTLLVIFTTFRSAFRERAMDDLSRSAAALVPMVQLSFADSSFFVLDEFVDSVSSGLETRVTVIGRDGSVFADSEKEHDEMENHRTRIEVIAAFNGLPGRSVRFSETMSREMLYTAVPVLVGDSIAAVVRTSMFFDSYSAALSPIVKEMILITLIAMTIAVLSGWIISRRISRPMRDLAFVAERVRRGDLGARAAPGHSREHNSLAASLNETLARNEELILDLSLSNNRNSAILQSMVEGVAVVSANGSILLLNESFRTMFCTGSNEEEIPSSLIEFFLTADSEQPGQGTFNHDSRTIAFSRANVEGSDNSVYSFRDVTRETQLTEMKRSFVTNVSHELRTPLTAIKGYTETLLDEITGENSRYLGVILRNTQRLIALVTDIQLLSEVENPEVSLKTEIIPFREIMDTVLPLFTARAESKNILIEFVQKKAAVNILADRYRVEQLFVNLLDNALKYTDSGGIEVAASTKGARAVFTVSDTGRGIPSESLPRVFERFFVVDPSRSRKSNGTGLGLAISKHIVEIHGGTISVRSTEGQGSIFLITLPLSLTQP